MTDFVISSAATCPHTIAYSLKKDYFGEMSAWRNIETFTVEYLIETAGPLTAPVFERIKADIVAEIVAAKSSARSDIRIISVDVPTSSDYLEGLVIFQKMTVVYEVKTLILNNADFADASTYGTLHATYLSPYVSDIDAFNESFDLDKGDSGEYSYTHNVSFTAQNGASLSAYAIAKVIGQGLLSSAEESSLTFLTYESQYNASLQVQNIYANNRKTFSETYDALKNTYSFTFTLKFRVGKDGGVNTYSYIEKYSMEMNDAGISKLTQTLSILGASSFSDALDGLTALKPSSYTRCNNLYGGFKQHDGSATTNSNALINIALSESTSFLRPSLQIEYSCSFSDDPSIISVGGGNYTSQESINWNVDEKGVSSIDVEVSLKSHLARSGADTAAVNLSRLASVGIVSLIEANPLEVSLSTLFGGAYTSLVNRVTTQISQSAMGGFFYGNFSRISRGISVDSVNGNSASGGNRLASYKCSYSNDPSFNRNIGARFGALGYGIIKKAEIKISTNLPSDSVKEFNIIGNRTILSYPFAMTEGTASVSCSMIFKRPSTNRLSSGAGDQYAALTNPTSYRDLIRDLIVRSLIPTMKDILSFEPRLAGASEVSLSFTKISFDYSSTGEVSIICEAKIKCKKSRAYAPTNRIGSIIT